MIIAPNKKALSSGELDSLQQQKRNKESGLLSAEQLDKLYQEHELGDLTEVLEGRSVTEALTPYNPNNEEVSESSEASMLPDFKAQKRPKHSDPDARRGYDYIDTDTID